MQVSTRNVFPVSRVLLQVKNPLHAILILAILCWILPTNVAAQKRNYTLDEDPVRLGGKALQQGELQKAKEYFEAALKAEYHPDRAHYGLAKIAVWQGRYKDAEPELRMALEAHQIDEHGDYPEARAALALLLLRFGREAEAENELKTALKSKADLWDAQYCLARLHLERKEWDKALKELKKGAALKGVQEGEDKYHFGMALYSMAKKDLDSAEKEALAAFHLNPADPEYGVLVGEIYQKREAPTLAISAFERVLKSPGAHKTAPMLYTLGDLYQSVGRYADARNSYLEAVQVDSTYAPALKDLAGLFFSAKQYDNAAKTYLRYVMLEHDDREALLTLSEACYLTARFDQAAEAAKTALKLDPQDQKAKYAFFKSGIQSRDPDTRARAAKLWPEMSRTSKPDATVLVALGTYQLQMGRFAEARNTLESVLTAEPQRADAHFQLGVLALKTHKPQDAITQFEAAIESQPKQPIYHLNLGIAYFQAKQLQAAIPPIRRALALNGSITVGRLLLAQALAASDSLGAAQVEFRQVLQDEPKNPKALRGLGYCQIRAKDIEGAIATYESATRADPKNADGWAGLGNAHLSAQHWDAAEAAFEKARKLDPRNATMLKGMELLTEAHPKKN